MLNPSEFASKPGKGSRRRRVYEMVSVASLAMSTGCCTSCASISYGQMLWCSGIMCEAVPELLTRSSGPQFDEESLAA